MLGNLICWAIALGMIFSKSASVSDFYTKALLAMGFIFLGTLCKAIDVYREIHIRENDKTVSNDVA